MRRDINEHLLQEVRDLTEDERENLLQLELDRLNRLQLAHWESALYGDVRATDAVLKIMAMRQKLTRLDVPDAKIDGQTVLIIGGNETDYIDKLKALS